MAEDFERVTLCDDGRYRWVYEKNLYRDLSILVLLLKVFAIVFVIFGLFMLLVTQDVMTTLKITGGVMVLIIILCIIGYLIYAVVMDGAYCVTFTMDEKGVTHAQHEKQVKKAEAIAALTVLVGLLARNPTAAGAGMIMRTTMYSDFRKVKVISLKRKKNTIHLDGNQVYAKDEDIDMVWEFIKIRCTNAKVKN